jgi:hypothetical protein
MIRGSVDIITTTEIHGWAYHPAQHEPVLVQAVLNHEILGEAKATHHRPDLVAAGIGSGRAGYVIKLRRPVDPLYLPFLSVNVEGGDIELPRAPTLGFAAFFTALYAANPGAGRNRSVFGGLWTDRTDAAALLRGKTAIKQISPTAAPVLTDLIRNGFALVEPGPTPPEAEWRAAPAERAQALLQQAELLIPLRAILEDNPLVVDTSFAGAEAAAFGQPSAKNPSPSPAECVEIVVALGEGVVLDIVRDSFSLPEFTVNGVSRWRNAGVAPAAADGFLDRHALTRGQAAIMSPGTIFRIHTEGRAKAVRMLVIPTRGMPARVAMEHTHAEVASDGRGHARISELMRVASV